MSTSQPPRRPSLLPKELDDIDAGWGEEQPTLAKARRASEAPIPLELEGADEDRPTTVPDEPPDLFAKRVMRDAGHGSTGPSLELAFQLEPMDDNIFDRPTKDGRGVPPPSQYPTAPPPAGFSNERARTVPRPGAGAIARFLEDSQRPTEPPPYEETGESRELNRLRRAQTPEIRPQLAHDFSGKFDTSPPREIDPVRDVKDRFAAGDFSGALALAEDILAKSPELSDVRRLAEKSREVLLDMFASRLGSLDRAVQVEMTPDQIRWLSLDHRAGFLLSMIDGISTVEELLDISGMPRLDALRIMCDLVEQRVIGLRNP